MDVRDMPAADYARAKDELLREQGTGHRQRRDAADLARACHPDLAARETITEGDQS